MKKNKTLIILTALALVLFAGSFVAAQEKAEAPEKTEEASCPSGMTPEMMAKWAEMAAPNENHKALEGMVGSWAATTKWWATPDGEPMVSSGTSVNSSVLGGRYVKMVYNGDMMGQPFEGLGYVGYDNYKQKYIHLWMDSMSTMMLMSEGTMADGVCTYTGEFDDVITGKKTTMRQVVTVTDDDHHMMEMFGPAPDGKEFRMMEIKYVRQ